MTRGLRNNNPLNIRRNGTAWSGLSAQQTDRSFCQFRDMAYGFRAAFITIHTYIFKHGLGTIAQIITRWAPPSDGNNTSAYIDAVCQLTHISKDTPLHWSDRDQMLALVQAMAYVENSTLISTGGSMTEGYERAMKSLKERKAPQ